MFTPQHIITILITLASPIVFYFILKPMNVKVSDTILVIFSFIGLSGVLGNLLIGIHEGTLMYKLPFHLCSWNAMLLPFAVIKKNRTICSMLSVWSVGALIAIVLNEEAVGYHVLGFKFFVYFIPHVFEFTVPLLMLLLGKFKMKFKDIIYSVLITLAVYTISYGVSELLVHHGYYVNYLFTMGPTNFVTEFAYEIIPFKYFYMMVFIPPILMLYMIAWLGSTFIVGGKVE